MERWDSWDWCLDGDSVRQTGWVGYHEFFGTAGQNDYTCDGDPRPLDAPAGTTWAMTCRMADRTTTDFTGTVIERTTLTLRAPRSRCCTFDTTSTLWGNRPATSPSRAGTA